MPRLRSNARDAVAADPALIRVLQAWIASGIVIALLLPVEAWHNHYIGWLPYWLLVAPTISLGLLRRQRLAAALSAFLVHGQRRRKPSVRRRAPRSPLTASLRTRRAAGPVAALIGR